MPNAIFYARILFIILSHVDYKLFRGGSLVCVAVFEKGKKRGYRGKMEQYALLNYLNVVNGLE